MNSQDKPTLPSSPTNSSRRTFLKGTGIASTLLASGIPTVHAAGDSVIRVGLIGCGGRGNGAARNAMVADPSVRIVALADLFDSSIQTCRNSLGKRYPEQFAVDDEHCFIGFDSYQKLLETELDAVLLASPPHYRPDHIEASVRAGVQIFCEKPVATDPTGVRRVEAACKEADAKGLNVVSGLCWRYDKGMVETISKIQDGAIGTLVSSQSNYLTGPVWIKTRKPEESEMEYQCRNWYYYNWLSGDHIVEQFIHSIDKALWLHHDKPPVKAYGLGGRQRRSDETQGDIYDHFAVVYEWEDKTRCFANTRQISGCFNQTEDFVYGTEGMAELCAHRIKGSDPWKFSGEEVQMHQAEQNEFFKAIRGQRERINNANYMCKSTLMAILGREACYTGGVISFDDVAMSPQDLRPETYEWGDGPAVQVPQPGQYKFPKPAAHGKPRPDARLQSEPGSLWWVYRS